MMYMKAIGFKIGFHQKNSRLFMAQHSGTKGIFICILTKLLDRHKLSKNGLHHFSIVVLPRISPQVIIKQVLEPLESK